MKNLSIGVKMVLFITPILLAGDAVFTALAVRYSRDYLVNEMQHTVLSFSQTVAMDIARGYEINNTRSLYSLLYELRQFDPRIAELSVVDSSGLITASLDVSRILTRDSTWDVQGVLQSHRLSVRFDEDSKQGITVVPIKTLPSTTVIGVFKVILSIDQLYLVIRSLERLIIIVSVCVFIFLSAGLLIMSRGLVVNPLQRFFPTLEKIERGDYSLPIAVKNNDEINVLAGHVNKMAAGLKEREFVKDTFSRYVPKEVVDQLLERKIRPRLEGELREITVFFSDLRGFTRMTERLGAEEIVRLLNRYFSAMTEIAIQFDGMIDKFAGDEIMILFGAPIGHDDDPMRAVRMGTAMQAELQDLNREFQREGLEKLEIGIGIATGKVVAGNIGSEKRLNYSVIGDTVNLAARLVSKADAGEMLISESTYRFVKASFKCKSLGRIRVKGKKKRVEVFAVKG